MTVSATGTNDLGYGSGEKPDRLLEAICQMHDRAKATGARTIAMAIPQFSLESVRVVCVRVLCLS